MLHLFFLKQQQKKNTTKTTKKKNPNSPASPPKETKFGTDPHNGFPEKIEKDRCHPTPYNLWLTKIKQS